MAHATKSTHKKPPAATTPTQGAGKTTLLPPANGHSQPAKPPAHESRIKNGVIERYEHGKLISRTPAKLSPNTAPAVKAPAAPVKPAPAKPATKAATSAPVAPPPPASIATPRDAQNSEHFVCRLGTEDIWGFRLVNPKDASQGVIVTHYTGYAVLSRHTHKPARADQIYHDMLAKGLVYVDGVVYKLMDEDQ
jgi:hypothetical protein